MRLHLTGADQAAADITKVREAIAAITEPARRAQAQVRRMAEAFDLMTSSARKAADGAVATVERMNAAIATEARQMRAELGTTFSTLGTSAEKNTTTATTAMSGLTAETVSAVERIRTATASAFAPIAESMATTAESVKAGFVSINAAMAETIAQAKAAAAEIKTLSMPAPSASASTSAAARRGGRHGTQGGHAIIRSGTKGLEAGAALLPFEVNPATAVIATAAGAAFERVQNMHAMAKLRQSGMAPESLGLTPEQFLRKLQNVSSDTGESVSTIAEAWQGASYQLSDVDPKQKVELFEVLSRVAEYESQSKKGASYAGSFDAAVKTGHMLGQYKTEDMRKLSNQLAAASLLTDASLDELVGTSGYFLPEMNRRMGMDYASGAALMVQLKNSGLTSTKAGTNTFEFFDRLYPKQGRGARQHNDALKKLGLTDAQGNPLFEVKGKDGKLDSAATAARVGEIVQRNTAGWQTKDINEAEDSAFGKAGGRVADYLVNPEFRKKMLSNRDKIVGASDGDHLAELQGLDPLQAYRRSWEDLKNVLSDIGGIVLPPLNVALEALDTGLKAIHATFGFFTDILPHGSEANRPQSREEINRQLQDKNYHPTSDIQWDDETSGEGVSPRTGWNAALMVWADSANNLRELKAAITGPAMAAWQGAKIDLDAIRDSVQTLGEGLAAIVKAGGIGGATAGGATNASYETGGSDGGIASAARGAMTAAGASAHGHIKGTLTAGGESFAFGSGGARGSAPIPSGSYEITPGAIGAWGRSHNAIGIAGNAIWDSSLGRMRRGIEIHASRSAALLTEGCVGVLKSQYPRLKTKIAEIIRQHGKAYLHVGPSGASIDGNRPADASAIVRSDVGSTGRRGIVHRHKHGDLIVQGASDPEQTANHVMRKLASSRLMNTIDSDFDT